MDATLSERQRDILGRVRRSGRGTIEAFASDYNVSTQTIRRDVNALCAAGALRRIHGGVEAPRGGGNLLYDARRLVNEGPKRAIAAAFARRIPAGASLAVSVGTTPWYAMQALDPQTDLSVLTNNLDVALLACERESWTLRLPGGTLRPEGRDILGPEVAAFFGRYQVDFGVFGVGGVAEDGSLLDFDEGEVSARLAIQANCRRSVLLLDHTKFGRPAHVRGGHLAEADTIICDAPLPPALAEALAGRGTEILITGKTE